MVVENMLTILHQHRIHSLSAIWHQVRMEETERLMVVQNMLTILHQHRIHSLSAIRHQVRMEETERLMVDVQNMLTILHQHRIHSLSAIKQNLGSNQNLAWWQSRLGKNSLKFNVFKA
jgi:hypothetical protein